MRAAGARAEFLPSAGSARPAWADLDAPVLLPVPACIKIVGAGARNDRYRPRKTGFCLATKAAVDVRWSSVAPIATCSSDSFASASVSVEADA